MIGSIEQHEPLRSAVAVCNFAANRSARRTESPECPDFPLSRIDTASGMGGIEKMALVGKIERRILLDRSKGVQGWRSS